MKRNRNDHTTKPFDSSKEGIKIVKVAAFCFAIVSWIATSQGLHEYVFQDYYWQAALVSFGIQAILFVFNLKLPEYFDLIGKRTPDNERQLRKTFIAHQMRYKWVPLQKLIAVFYAVILLASSFFSFVYITNLVYRDTRYLDANIALDRIYRSYLGDVTNYVNEYKKITRIIISKRLAELQLMIPDAEAAVAKTKEELDQEVFVCIEEVKKKQNCVESVEREYEDAKEVFKIPLQDRWRSVEDRKKEEEAVRDANNKLVTAQNELSTAERKLQEAERARDGYKPPADKILHDFLVEILAPSPEPTKLNSIMTSLNDYVVQIDEVDVSIENFTDIVTKTQELTLVINNFEKLQTMDISELDQNILNTDITIPEPSAIEFDAQKEQWEDIWKRALFLLQKNIKSVPDYTEIMISGLDDIEEVVNVQVLSEFKKQEVSNNIDRILRSNLANINALERACNFLFSNSPFLAWFSLILALFFDTSSLMAGLFIYITSTRQKTTLT